MSSTEVGDVTLARFHAERILPAADAVRARGVELLAPGRDPEAATYWVARAPGAGLVVRMERARIAYELARRWEARGLPELAALGGPLMELSAALAEAVEEPQEVSPFIYTIY
jgi:hypothetical protein